MHTIRLREPWPREWTDAANSANATLAAQYHRYFHRPSGLLDQQPVTLVLVSSWLVTSTAQLRRGSELDSDSASLQPRFILCALRLNSQPLQFAVQRDNSTQATHFSVRIDPVIEPYNLLEIDCELLDHQPSIDNDFDSVTPPPQLTDWAEVRIEIHD